MDTDAAPSPRTLRSGRSTNTPLIPEIDAYLHLLVLLYLLDNTKTVDAVKCAGKEGELIIRTYNFYATFKLGGNLINFLSYI